MPTSSVLSEFTFSNLGPLTTSWTAPASCATSTGAIEIGPASVPGKVWWNQNCEAKDYGCVPTGTSENPALITGLNPTNLFQAVYFSPGLYCPAGWTTAGVASRDGTKPVTWAGVFSPTATIPTTLANPIFNARANVLMQLLEPSETAAICCPSSMTAGPYIGCYSTLPDYKITTGCENIIPPADITAVNQTFWYDGQTIKGQVYTPVGTTPMTLTMTTSWQAVETSSLAAYSVLPFVTLIHKPADYSVTATAGALATSNAAIRSSSLSGSWDVIGILLSVTALSMILGAAIILPGA